MDGSFAKDCCATRWPLLLVHGLGFHDSSRYRYWGRIPEALLAHGAHICYGLQDAWGSCESNAHTLRATLLDFVGQTACGKVNIIAHSKGGLDTRVLAAMKDCAPYIASLTTIASPHAGSRTMDVIMRVPAPLFRLAAVPVNGLFRLMGDVSPDFYGVCSQLTTASMQGFNERYLAAPDLYRQSYAGVMTRVSTDVTMAFSYLVVRCFDGPNDGLVALASTPFGEFRGVIKGAGPRGLSHCDVIDLRRRPREKGAGAFDIVDWYIRLVSDLRERGL
jgi:triacylglycerol lipase